MISFTNFKTEDGRPIYLQILDFIKRGAVAGTIADGDELPSRRVLSALLGINPNTVQKAFRLLEEEGLIESRAGAGSYMTLSPEKAAELKIELLTSDIRGITGALKRTGISREEALQLISRYWDEPAGGAADGQASDSASGQGGADSAEGGRP
ncbi:MAG: GntR family transcriptional regulator [Firmicutes bacterium]|nr:GntR family transcriptional regulator [Bacillota bacterium]